METPDCTKEDTEDAAIIAALNDQLRTTFAGGRVLMTRGVQALADETIARVLKAVRKFDDFTEDNDPWGLHDCAFVEVDGVGEKVMFKVDAYDQSLEYGSPNPADPTVTTRVLTILLANEY